MTLGQATMTLETLSFLREVLNTSRMWHSFNIVSLDVVSYGF
jgi:hypothetical protein